LAQIGPVVSEKTFKNKQHPFYNFRPFVSSVYFRTKKNITFLEDYPINILAQFGFNWPSDSEKKIKMLKLMNEDHDGCQSDGKQC
jgi:hypothetical protein